MVDLRVCGMPINRSKVRFFLILSKRRSLKNHFSEQFFAFKAVFGPNKRFNFGLRPPHVPKITLRKRGEKNCPKSTFLQNICIFVSLNLFCFRLSFNLKMDNGEHTIMIDGLRFHFRVSGKGSNVVLMHGWGCSTEIWAGIEAEFAKNFRVWNIDFPGFGQSQAPDTPWGVEDYTRNFEQFCQMNSIDNPTLVGHSFGGRVAIVFASRNQVNKMILVDAAGVLPVRGLKYYAKVYSYKAMKHLAPMLLGKERGEKLIAQRRKASGSSDYNALPEAMRGTFVKVVNQDLCPYMPQIKAPTLVIGGEKDLSLGGNASREIAAKIPGAELRMYEQWGHGLYEEAKDFNQVVLEFLCR